MGLYWRIEKEVRELESASGSVVGATGAFYGVRRDLSLPFPPTRCSTMCSFRCKWCRRANGWFLSRGPALGISLT